MSRSRIPSLLALLAATVVVTLPADRLAAQTGLLEPSVDPSVLPAAWLDPAAHEIHSAASGNWGAIDASVLRYTARVQQRIAAKIRAPLKDRILYRNESAARVFWDRDHDTFVQALGARSQYPGSRNAEIEDVLDDLTIQSAFDPGGDRLAFGLGGGDDPEVEDRESGFWIAHPLAPGADSLYRYRSGDTLTLRLPDGGQLRTVELEVIPRRLDVHLISGVLWIEPESGALVRAVYRLAEQFDAIRDLPELQAEEEAGSFRWVPGLFKPWTFDLKMIAIDYSLWDFEVWLPHSMRIEAKVGAGVLGFPLEMDLAYRIENVVLEDDLGTAAYEAAVLEERHFESRAEAMAFLAELMGEEEGIAFEVAPGSSSNEGRTSRFLVPQDPSVLATSDQLPPPIWEDAPGFADSEELEELFGELADVPIPAPAGIAWDAAWGPQRPDLLRYNRVEGLAIGGRAQARVGSPAGPISLKATAFVGLADPEPKLTLELERSTPRRRWLFSAYRDLSAVSPQGRPLELGNSLNALLWGRDEGDWYRTTGFSMALSRPEAERQRWRLTTWAERQDPLAVETDFALAHLFDDGWSFRPNLVADRIEEAGAGLRLTPWWGEDPLLPQFGMELGVEAAAWRPVGPDDEVRDWTRASATLRTAIPLAQARWRIGAEVGAGRAWGEVPRQRNWLLGGTATLRGYPAATLVGESFGRARLELARVFPATTLTVFGDGGWAGDADRFDGEEVLWSVGVGASLLDGLIRLDLSRGLDDRLGRTRLDLYLDAIL